MIGEDLEKGDESKETKDLVEPKEKEPEKGMSQSSKDDIGVCVTIILITVLAIIVTSIKIVVIDMYSPEYAALFGNNITTTTTTSATPVEDDVRFQ